MTPPRFGPAISWLQKLFAEASRQVQTKLNFALIGGLSVTAWGAVRATQDIDFLMDSEPSPMGDLALRKNLENFFKHRGCRVEWRVGDFAIGSNGSLPRSLLRVVHLMAIRENLEMLARGTRRTHRGATKISSRGK